MTFASRLTGGLAWAGLVLVIGVPAINMLWPEGPSDREVLSAAPAGDSGQGAPKSLDARPAPAPTAAPVAVATVKPVAPPLEPTVPGKPKAEAEPIAAPRDLARSVGTLARATTALSTLEPAAPAETVAAAESAKPEPATGPRVETTADSVIIIPRGATASAAAAPPAPVDEPAAAATAHAATTAAPESPALANAPSSGPKPAGSDMPANAASPEEATGQLASAASAPEVPPVPAPLSQRPPSRPSSLNRTETASISVRSRPDYVAPPPAYSSSPSIVVVEPPQVARPLPAGPGEPIVTEDELRGWKSGTLEQYLASKGLLRRGRSRAPDFVQTRPNGYGDSVPSDGQYYDEGDPGYPYAY